MNKERPFQGSLFVEGLLSESIVNFPEWQEFDDEAFERTCSDLLAIFTRFPVGHSPNESQTEDDLIWPVLEVIGWKERLRQQNLSPRGRDDVPDGLLFADRKARDLANGFADEWQRYRHGLAIVESKRWMRPLDRRSGHRGEESTPSTQMLRYLRRVDSLTDGKLRWGILTNGYLWRLYYSGARSVSEQFFEFDLASILNASGDEDRAADIRKTKGATGLRYLCWSFGARHSWQLQRMHEHSINVRWKRADFFRSRLRQACQVWFLSGSFRTLSVRLQRPLQMQRQRTRAMPP